MRPNELMIGDWVRFTDPDTNETELHRISQEDFSGNDKFWNRFSSIEITPEILEANGIKTDSYLEQQLGYKNSSWYVVEDDYGMHKYTQDPVFHFGRLDDTFDGLQSLTLCNIRSVHEFQHALRMIGLSDLADNFKIKEGGRQ